MGNLTINELFQFGASEFVGTMLLILLGNGVVATCILNGTKGKGSG
jgi:glycerol uptake facilitator-like aquaporin